MEPILKDWARLLRALILFSLLGFIIYGIISLFLDNIYSEGDLSIETTEKGTFVIKVSKKNTKDSLTRYTQFLLPSNECWYDTGLDIDENESCAIKVSGTVHLAADKLIESVSVDTLPSVKWTTADGNEWSRLGDSKECQQAKEQLLLLPGRTIGNVVGYFYTDYNVNNKQFINYFLQNRQKINSEGQIFSVGKAGTFPNITHKKARLYLSVNDIMLNMVDSASAALSKMAYTTRNNHRTVESWAKVSAQPDYYRLWFDDNIGGFLVNVTITRQKKN